MRDHVHGRRDLAFQELGPLNLKNIARPVEAFVVRIARPKAPMTASMPDMSITNAPRPSLVVLPFSYVGGDGNDDYTADVITEDLITDLSRLPGALVIASRSAATYKHKPVDIRRVGYELGVRYVIEGSVRKLGDLLRVNVQLVSTEANTLIWAGSFDQDVKELGIGQEAIVARLRAVLGVQVFDSENARNVRERPGHGASFSEHVQSGFNRKMHGLTKGDLSAPFVFFCMNAERCTGYNLALRLVALGYTRVYWYRGGSKRGRFTTCRRAIWFCKTGSSAGVRQCHDA